MKPPILALFIFRYVFLKTIYLLPFKNKIYDTSSVNIPPAANRGQLQYAWFISRLTAM